MPVTKVTSPVKKAAAKVGVKPAVEEKVAVAKEVPAIVIKNTP